MADTVQNINTQQAADVAKVTAQLAATEQQLQALSDKAVAARKDLRNKWREANAKRFEDLDYKAALIGQPTEHTVVIGGATKFFLRPPTGAILHEVDKFITDPTVPLPGDPTKSASLGPVVEVERILMTWLVASQMAGGPRQEILRLPPPHRLQAVRCLSEALAVRLAEECGVLRDWLNVVLEIELGNF
jgi:hypothetical protein